MANINVTLNDPRNQLGATPWGNTSTLAYTLETDATGKPKHSDAAGPAAVDDVIRIGVIPAGFRLFDSQVLIGTALTASVTGDLGFAYVDGVNDTAVPQDADYFGAALVLSAAARLRNATANPTVVLPKDAYLTLTVKGAANAKASKLEVLLSGIADGVA